MLSTGLLTALSGIACVLSWWGFFVSEKRAQEAVKLAGELRLAMAAVKAAELQLRSAIDRADELEGKVASLRGLVYRGRRTELEERVGDGAPPPQSRPTEPYSAPDEFTAMLRLQQSSGGPADGG